MTSSGKHNLIGLLLKYALFLFCMFLFISFPVTAILSWMFGGPLWPSLVVNAMLIHIALTAFYPGSSSLRLLIPITVYAASQVGIAMTRATVIERAHIYESANHLSEPVLPETDLVFGDTPDWALVRDVALLSPKRRVFEKGHRLSRLPRPFARMVMSGHL